MSTKQAIFVDSSISDTIRTCIVLGNHKAAMKVKTDFKVGEVTLILTGLKLVACSKPFLACAFRISFYTVINCFSVYLSQVSEKRWYWLKAFALATIRDWETLEKFSKEKRPPIGKALI